MSVKKITIYPAPHLEIRLHLSEEMIRDYRDCLNQVLTSDFEETKDCNKCSWKDVKLQEVGMCELIELSKLIGSDEEEVTEVDGCRSH